MVLSIWGWTIVSHNANSIVYLPFSLSTHPIWTVFTGEVWAAPFALSRCPVWHFQLCWGCIAVIFVNCCLIAVENPSGPPCFGTRWLPSCGWPARRQHLKDMCFLREVVRFILTICCLFQPASSGLFSDPLHDDHTDVAFKLLLMQNWIFPATAACFTLKAFHWWTTKRLLPYGTQWYWRQLLFDQSWSTKQLNQ